MRGKRATVMRRPKRHSFRVRKKKQNPEGTKKSHRRGGGAGGASPALQPDNRTSVRQSCCSQKLEAEAELELDDAAGKAVRRAADLCSVGYVGLRRGGRKGLQIQDVKGIKEIAAELELGVFA